MSYLSNASEKLFAQTAMAGITAPTFSGISSATPNVDGSVTLAWSTATGGSATPIRYKLYVASGSVSGTVLFASTSSFEVVGVTSFKIYTDSTGATLAPGATYTFGVRAVDSIGNMETNLAVTTAVITYNLYALVSAIPTNPLLTNDPRITTIVNNGYAAL